MEFKVDDRVWCLVFGWGKVVKISEDEEITYPIEVEFECGEYTVFTKTGQIYICSNRCLFFEEVPIPESALKRPKWRAEEGEDYYSIDSIGRVTNHVDYRSHFSQRFFELGNYFQTEEEAKESKFYKVFHEEK